MSQPFLGAIKMFAYKHVPANYALCDGRPMPLQNSAALYSLLGMTYGGSRGTLFNLPDLRGHVPIHRNHDDMTSVYPAPMGMKQGSKFVTLTPDNMPRHSHNFQVSTKSANAKSPDEGLLAKERLYTDNKMNALTPLHSDTVREHGEGHFHKNMMPSIGINFCIALSGTYPIRS